MHSMTSIAVALAGVLLASSAIAQTTRPGVGSGTLQTPSTPQPLPGISGSGPGTLQPGTPGATVPQVPGSMPPGTPGTGTPGAPSMPGAPSPAASRVQAPQPTPPCPPQSVPGQGLTPPPCVPGVGGTR